MVPSKEEPDPIQQTNAAVLMASFQMSINERLSDARRTPTKSVSVAVMTRYFVTEQPVFKFRPKPYIVNDQRPAGFRTSVGDNCNVAVGREAVRQTVGDYVTR